MPTLLSLLLAFVTLLGPLDREKDWETLRESKDVLAQIAAAKSIVADAARKSECAKVAPELLEIGTKFSTHPMLRDAIAAALGGVADPELAKLVAQHLGSAQDSEKLFLLRAAQASADEALDRVVRDKLLPDRLLPVRLAALDLLVRHRSLAALPAIEGLLRDVREPALHAPALAAASSLRRGGPDWPAWEAKLVEFAHHKLETLRMAALAELAQDSDGSREELFLEALGSPDWPARSLAADWLEKHFTKRGLGALIARLPLEPAGSRMRSDLARALRHLTAMPLGDDAALWTEWWKNNSAAFEFPASAGGPRSGSSGRPKSEGTSVAGRFYGMEVETRRVIFVIDVSGSMQQAVAELPKDFGDAATEKPSRIEVAKHELSRLVDELPGGTLFNIISFETGVDSWLERLSASPLAPKTRPAGGGGAGPRTGSKPAERGKDAPGEKAPAFNAKLDAELRAGAHAYVDKLQSLGATNLYDALELAFADPLVDTLFVLSDGQPTHGRVIDPAEIRAEVQRWNATRRLRIHTVSVGTDFEILRWLAQDSGGEHRFVR